MAIINPSWNVPITHSMSTNTATTSLSINGHVSPPIVKIHTGSDTTLTIWNDGTVSWEGSINTSMKTFINVLQHHIDILTTERGALERSYRKGLEHCLNAIQNKTKEEFVTEITAEIQHRILKQVENTLKE